MKEKSALRALLEAKCPRCKKGEIFAYGPYNRRYYSTNICCAECGLVYEKEPSFFTGAMYISYAMNVALVIAVGVGTYILGKNPSLTTYFVVMAGVYLPFMPLIFRYSRVLMLYLFGDI